MSTGFIQNIKKNISTTTMSHQDQYNDIAWQFMWKKKVKRF